MSNWLFSVGLAALAGSANIIGGSLALRKGAYSETNISNTLAAVAGFLLAAAFLDLIPETAEASVSAMMYVFAGYLVVHLAESLFPAHEHNVAKDHPLCKEEHEHSHECEQRFLGAGTGLVASVGLAVHSYFDGVALAAGSAVGAGTGLLLLLAIAIHQLPVGFGLTAIMRASGHTPAQSLAAAAILFASTTIGGLSAAVFNMANPGFEHITLAFSAGTFIYIGATDMIPATHVGGSRYSVLYSLAGVAVFLATSQLLRSAGLE